MLRAAAFVLVSALPLFGAGVALGADTPDQDRALLQLIDHLRSDERWQTRSESAMLLGRSGDIRARRALVRALQDPHYGVRAAAVRAIVTLGDVRALPAIFDTLGDDEPFVRLEARRAVDRFELDAERPYLLHTLRYHPDARARIAAVERASELGDDAEVLDAFLEASGEPDQVGRLATSMITRLPGPKAVALLLLGLHDGDYRVQIASMQTLADLDAPEAAEPIVELLDSQMPDVTLAAADAVHGLARHVDTQRYLVTARRSKDRFERARALKVLGAVGGEEAATVLLNAADDPDVFVRGAAVAGLGAIGEARAIPKLEEMKKREENARILTIVKITLASLIRIHEEHGPRAPPTAEAASRIP